MQQFDYYLDRKITVWVRELHTIDAESKEEADKEMVNRFHDNMCVDTFDEQEYMFDTEEYLEPGDNGGAATAELYDEDSNILTTNTDLVDSK